MYISKKQAKRITLKWIEELNKLSQENKPSWIYIGRTARETIGALYVLWMFDLLSDKQWGEYLNEVWDIKQKAENASGESF